MIKASTYFFLVALTALLYGCETGEVTSPDTQYRELLLLQQSDSTRELEGGVRYGFPDGGDLGESLPVSLKMMIGPDFNTMRVQHIATQTVVFSGTIYPYASGQRMVPAVLDSASTFIRQNSLPMIDPATVTWLTPMPDSTGEILGGLWTKIDDLKLVERFINGPHLTGVFHYDPSISSADDAGKYYWLFYR
jgi:hypothetical protein